MKPIVHLFTPIFFVMVGLALNLREVSWGSAFIWAFSLSLLGAAIAGKVVGAFVIGGSRRSRLTVGLAMVPRREVALVFAELGRASGIFDNQIYAGVIIVIGLTTLGPPFLLKWRMPRPREAPCDDVMQCKVQTVDAGGTRCVGPPSKQVNPGRSQSCPTRQY